MFFVFEGRVVFVVGCKFIWCFVERRSFLNICFGRWGFLGIFFIILVGYIRRCSLRNGSVERFVSIFGRIFVLFNIFLKSFGGFSGGVF